MSDQTLNDILEVVTFLKDNMVSADESDKILTKVVGIEEQIKNVPTRDEMNEKFSEVIGEVDSFVKLHETLDQELSALRSKYSRLEERLLVVERKLQIA
ncbi:MAG: hypothetical protein WA057_00520 [Candidatus Magasanikiibacteriota bacterium]